MHNFVGKWITDEEFYSLEPRNVFFRYLDSVKLDCTEHLNRHILFRKSFVLGEDIKDAKVYISQISSSTLLKRTGYIDSL